MLRAFLSSTTLLFSLLAAVAGVPVWQGRQRRYDTRIPRRRQLPLVTESAMLLYSASLAAALMLSAPVWLVRMLRQGRYRQGLPERLGRVPGRLRRFAEGKEVFWLHAVSVGEVLAATRLVQELEQVLPRAAIVISTTTPTGQGVARERFGADRVFFFPLDFAFAVRAYLRALQPRMLVLMESELWPRVLVECDRAWVAVAVVNARVSDRSLPRYMRLRALWRPLLRRVPLLLAQSAEDARRWSAIGARPDVVKSLGNLKYDIHVDPSTPLAQLLREHLPANSFVLLCGSTHPGEEAMLLDCWGTLQEQEETPILILAPRHPQRSDEVMTLVRQRGFPCIRASDWRAAPASVAAGLVVVVDTVGELAALYSLASVAFVGGSLVGVGGHNPLEPAQFGVPTVMGPHYENFRAMVDAMRDADALRLTSAEAVCADVLALKDGGRTIGERARTFADAQKGATGRTVEALLDLRMRWDR